MKALTLLRSTILLPYKQQIYAAGLLRRNYFSAMKYLLVFLSILTWMSCKERTMNDRSAIHVIRLKPGEDLRQSLTGFVRDHQIKAGWIITCVGSLTQYHLRFANQPQGDTAQGHFEIVSLTGTLSVNGSHLHMAVSDSSGATIGGHLLDGNIVYTTAEIVIGTSDDLEFTREKDGTTPWQELQVKRQQK